MKIGTVFYTPLSPTIVRCKQLELIINIRLCDDKHNI